VRTWDAIIVGAGIIGLSLAIELNKRGLKVLIIDKGEPGREASWAAGGMLADFPLEMPPQLADLATASARLYPEFVHELEDESHLKIDLRSQGTIVFVDRAHAAQRPELAARALPKPLCEFEPAFRVTSQLENTTPLFLNERSVDPRHLTSAAIASAQHRGIDSSSGDHVQSVEIAGGKAAGVRTNKTTFAAAVVVNCAGAWAGQLGPHPFPTRPVKGQMLCVAMPEKELLTHTIRTPDVYLIPRSDGRLLIGATQEEAGFDKRTIPETIQKLRQSALDVVPQLANARFLEAWAGLRPGTPDALPILGATPTPGYFVATGHFRDGILLAPITARVMAHLICEGRTDSDLAAFQITRVLNDE